jgi:endonuclease YncB( thermonuclease family)
MSKKYTEYEKKAKKEKIGIWSTKFQTPSKYRKSKHL